VSGRGREQDYRPSPSLARGATPRLDATVDELRRVVERGPAYDGGQPVAAAPHTPGGTHRCWRPPWAEVDGAGPPGGRGCDRVLDRCRPGGDRPRQLPWPSTPGRRGSPRPSPAVSGSSPPRRPRRRCRAQAPSPRAYLAVFGDAAADALSAIVELSSPAPPARRPGRRRRRPGATSSSSCPGTVDPTCLERTTEGAGRLSAARRGDPQIEKSRPPDTGLVGTDLGHPTRPPTTCSGRRPGAAGPEGDAHQIGQQASRRPVRRPPCGAAAGDDLAGHPTTTESGGTSRTTTALAPMGCPSRSSPGQHLGAGADRHPVPTVGWRLPGSRLVPPRVTPW